jgi:hypothetical protein
LSVAIFVEAIAALGLPLNPVELVPVAEVCCVTVGRLPLLSRPIVPMPAGVLVLPADGFDVAVALSDTEVSDAGVAFVPWSVAVAGSPSFEETVTELFNDVFAAMSVATVAGNVTGGRVVPGVTGYCPV